MKRQGGAQAKERFDRFPPPRGGGSVEAQLMTRHPQDRPSDFRPRAGAAPLKPHGTPGGTLQPIDFRPRAGAAPLKLN